MNGIRLMRDGASWTAFDTATGLKVTASPAGQTLTKTRVPELLDVSVTNHCSVDCVHCQANGKMIRTPDGEAPTETIELKQAVCSDDPFTRRVCADTGTQVQRHAGNLVPLNHPRPPPVRLTPDRELLTPRSRAEAGELKQNGNPVEWQATPVQAGLSTRTPPTGQVSNFAAAQHQSAFSGGLLELACCRDSKPGLPHATLENLRAVASAAADAGVFECALGGGEITEHPDFLEVLRTFSNAGLTTNFTTRRPQLVADRWAEIGPLIGAFAVSVGSVNELERLATLCLKSNIPTVRVNLHLTLGTLKERVYFALLEHAAAHGFRVTLLGCKTTAREAQVPAIPYPWWLRGLDVARAAGLGLSIDTAVAAEYQADLLAAGIDPRTFHTREGHCSAFVDAVSMTLSPSSCEPWPDQVPFGPDWLEHYRTFSTD